MAEVRLSDVVEPMIFTPMAMLRSLRKSVFFQTGIAATNQLLARLAQASEGGTFNLPRFNNLDRSIAANNSSDNPAGTATPNKTSQVDQVAVKLRRNAGWSSMDLVAALNSGEDPMQAIAADVGDWWADKIDQSMVFSMLGWAAALEAAFANQIVYPVTAAGADWGTEIVNARGLLGDRADELSTLLVTGRIYTSLNAANLIDFIPDARGETMFGTYQGMRIVNTDALDTNAVGQGAGIHFGYLTVPGAIMFGEGSPRTPTAVDRKEELGDGEGQEILWNRRHWVGHMDGLSFAGAIVNGQTPSDSGGATDLDDAVTWTVQYADADARKRYPMVQLQVTY